MILPTHIATPPGDVPASPDTPPHGAGRDTLSQATARALNSPVIVTDIGDGAQIVEPLHFHRVVRRGGFDVVSKSHAQPNAMKGRHDNV